MFNAHSIQVQKNYKWTTDEQSLIKIETATANCQQKMNHKAAVQKQYIYIHIHIYKQEIETHKTKVDLLVF